MNAQIGQILQYHCARMDNGECGPPTTDTQYVVIGLVNYMQVLTYQNQTRSNDQTMTR